MTVKEYELLQKGLTEMYEKCKNTMTQREKDGAKRLMQSYKSWVHSNFGKQLKEK